MIALFRLLGALALSTLVVTTALVAQVQNGAIVGKAIDPSGAAIPAAKVTALEQNSGVQTVTEADAEGNYNFPLLVRGVYRLEAEAPGFRQLVRSGIELRVNDRLRLDLEMKVGEVTQSVVVTGGAPLVETETGAIGSVIENRKIVNLPLNTRNPFQLAVLVPGVMPSPSMGDSFNNTLAFAVNGGRGNTSEIMIDGASSIVQGTNPINAATLFPSPDAVEEFKLQTNSYSAQYGRSGGGVVNVVMKSGTNSFHGVGFNFLRNSKLDTNNFFSNKQGVKLGSFKRNQFGGSIGGPILKNRAFFIASYEVLRQRSQSTQRGSFPTQLERQGDFSATRRVVGGLCAQVNIYDPFSTRPAPVGGYVRTAFPDNMIPSSVQDPVGRKMVAFWPAGNTAGDPCTGLNNFFADMANKVDSEKLDMKVDWVPDAKNRLTLGGGFLEKADTQPYRYGNIATPTNFNGDAFPAKNLRLNFTRTHSPTSLINVVVSAARFQRIIDPAAPADFSITSLGFPQKLAAQTQPPEHFPHMTFTDYSELGRSLADLAQAGNNYSGALNVTKVLSRHTIQAGFDLRTNQVGDYRGGDRSGLYNFDRSFTQGPDPTKVGQDKGNAIASLLTGLGNSGQIRLLPSIMTSNHYYGAFIQDDFKVSSRLVFNIGLRYELEDGRTERHNALGWFDFDVQSPLAAITGLPIKGGMRYVGVDGNSRHQFDTDKNNFAPRFSVAYSLSPKMVIRAGYGIFYLPFTGQAAGRPSAMPGYVATTTWASSLDGITPRDVLSNPFPDGLTQPSAPQAGLMAAVGANLGSAGSDSAIDRGSRVGYAQQWNFNIQRELPRNTSIEVAYTGSRGIKLSDGPNGLQLNQLDPTYMSLGDGLLKSVANPFYGIVKTGPLSGATTTRGQLLRPYPQYLGLLSLRPATAASTYHAFQARFDKRFSSGLTMLLSYTNAKLIDDASQAVGFLGQAPTHQNVYNRRADRSLSGLDISQRFVASFVYAVPAGRGKALGSGMPRWMDLAIGNWQVNGIVTFSTSIPLAITNSQNNAGAWSDTQRPNVNGDPKLSGGRSTDENLNQWFNTSVFSQPATYTFGNLGRTLPTVRGDGINNFDLSLFKDFPIKEAYRVEFRAEAFNALNTPQMALPNLAFGSGNFGKVLAQANSPRQVQLGLKVYF